MIALRSPYYIIVNNTNLTSADIDIRIYTGALDSSVSSPQYSLSGTAIDETVIFDISELCRDYIDSTFDGDYDCTAVYVNYQVTEYISSVAQTPESVVSLEAFDAYTDFEEGVNSTTDTYSVPSVLQSNNVIYRYADTPFNIPIHQDGVDRVTFLNRGVEITSQTITGVDSNTNIIRYISSDSGNGAFMDRVLADSGVIEGDSASILNSTKGFETMECDSVIIEPSSGDILRYTVISVSEGKYVPVKVTFVNKYGALQDMWFFKKHELTSSVSSDDYRRNILTSGSYSTTKHVDYSLRRNSKEGIKLNSGLYSEEYSEVFRQLLLSESVWIKYDNKTIPVITRQNSHTYMTSVNDKKVEFSLQLEFAFNKINDVR